MISARWIPQLMNEKQRAISVSCAKKIIKLFKKRKHLPFSNILNSRLNVGALFLAAKNV